MILNLDLTDRQTLPLGSDPAISENDRDRRTGGFAMTTTLYHPRGTITLADPDADRSEQSKHI